jgi:hypothetical protein
LSDGPSLLLGPNDLVLVMTTRWSSLPIPPLTAWKIPDLGRRPCSLALEGTIHDVPLPLILFTPAFVIRHYVWTVGHFILCLAF